MSVQIRISVRQLVEFLCRSGDLEAGSGASSGEVMLEGARMHRKIQKEAGPGYRAEVPLSVCLPIGESLQDGPAGDSVQTETAVQLLLEGRADGLFFGTDPGCPVLGEAWTIDEIKTSYGKVGKMKEPVPVHLAQARVYAWIWMQQEDLDRVRVRLSYICLSDESRKNFTEELQREMLEEWFRSLLAEYERWILTILSHQERRDRSIRTLEFPYVYRTGQKDLAVHVYHTICHGRKLFLEAPTGTGKTLAVLYPSIKAMGEKKTDRLFYLTAKTVTRAVAEDTVQLLRDRGLLLKSIVLTARDRICPMEHPVCDPETCPRARGHYDRVNAALFELLTDTDDYSGETIRLSAERHCVCPFELSLDLSVFSDLVIGDYNHVFDPRARLRRFFGDTTGAAAGSLLGQIRRENAAEGDRAEGPVILIDEVHNLVDRGREMFSASLSLGEVRSFRTKIRPVLPVLWKKLGRLSSLLRELGVEAEGEEYLPVGDNPLFLELTDTAWLVYGECEAILAQERMREQGRPDGRLPQGEQREAFLQFYFDLRHYLAMSEEMDDHYVPCCMSRGKEQVTVRLFCVDPSRMLKDCMDRARSSILFSATLLPLPYYKSLLGGTGEDYEVSAKSVFDSRRQGLFIAGDINSRYRERGPETYRRLAGMIRDITSRRHGNYLIFFPSYAFLREVYKEFSQLCPPGGTTRHLVQEPQMPLSERESFLSAFEQVYDDRSLLGFCVLGGVFSEGIDLAQDRLIGVIIVGTGLPQVCAEREIVRQHFEQRGMGGYDYAYRFPGMNKVLQAAGRVIRTEDDVGIVVLLDERFLTQAYRRLLPRSWGEFEVVGTGNAGDRVTRFWDEWL